MFDDIRLRPLCSNGMTNRGYPEVRPLVQALIDMGWDAARREKWLREYMNKDDFGNRSK